MQRIFYDSSISIAANLRQSGIHITRHHIPLFVSRLCSLCVSCSGNVLIHGKSRRRWKRREAVPRGWWNNRVYYNNAIHCSTIAYIQGPGNSQLEKRGKIACTLSAYCFHGYLLTPRGVHIHLQHMY